nr:MAG TPA: hypothetical protein [Crassvirales sp.]
MMNNKASILLIFKGLQKKKRDSRERIYYPISYYLSYMCIK